MSSCRRKLLNEQGQELDDGDEGGEDYGDDGEDVNNGDEKTESQSG